tara:strand:- start:33 stop:851 length:819 start_codon:yes stop_codon:yes gene_type:complete
MFKSKASFFIKKKSVSSIFLTFLFIFTFILVLFNKTDYFLVNKIKYIGIDFISPITKIISSPAKVFDNITVRFQNIYFLENENSKLKEEIIRLKKWQTLAIKNTRENRVFKKLLNSTTNQLEVVKTASVINHSNHMYAKTVTINAGKNHNIKENQAVINEKGLIGKVITTTNKNSKILLINDQNSSVSVKNLFDSSFSIVSGTSDGKYLISSFIKNSTMPKVGDLLVTSGNAKIFPNDILVGKVIIVNKDNFLAMPYVDFNDLSYLQVIKSK